VADYGRNRGGDSKVDRGYFSTKLRVERLEHKSISSIAVFLLSLVIMFSAGKAFSRDMVALTCVFSVQCEIGTEDCTYPNRPKLFSFPKSQMIEVQPDFIVLALKDVGRGSALTMSNSGEARLLEFPIPKAGGSRSVGQLSYGHCQYKK
jgi:hypothetical protein